jgi:hypothetical protein
VQLQQWLATAENRVTVPYAGQLAELIAPVAVRLRRDFNTLLALIRAHAVLHQLTRDRDDDGRIVATLEDYEIVSGIVADVLAEGVGSTVSQTIRQTVAAVQSLDQGEGVTSSVIAERLALDKSAAHRRMTAAAAAGYVQNLEDRRGRPGRWRPAAPLPDDVALLPSVARLQEVTEPVATPHDHETQQTSDTDEGGCTVARVTAPKGNGDPKFFDGFDPDDLYRCPLCGSRTDPQRRGDALHPSLCQACTQADLVGRRHHDIPTARGQR